MSTFMASASSQSNPVSRYMPPQRRSSDSTGSTTSSSSFQSRRKSAALTSGDWRASAAPFSDALAISSVNRPQTAPPAARSQATSRPRGLAGETLSPGQIVYIPAQTANLGDWLVRQARPTDPTTLPFAHPAMIVENLNNGKVRLLSLTSFGEKTLNDKYPKDHTITERSRYRFIHHPDHQEHKHPDNYPSLRMKGGPSALPLTKPSYINIEDAVECSKDCLRWFMDGVAQKDMAVDPADLPMLSPTFRPNAPAPPAALPAPSVASWIASRHPSPKQDAAKDSSFQEILQRRARQRQMPVTISAIARHSPLYLGPLLPSQNIYVCLPEVQ